MRQENVEPMIRLFVNLVTVYIGGPVLSLTAFLNGNHILLQRAQANMLGERPVAIVFAGLTDTKSADTGDARDQRGERS